MKQKLENVAVNEDGDNSMEAFFKAADLLHFKAAGLPYESSDHKYSKSGTTPSSTGQHTLFKAPQQPRELKDFEKLDPELQQSVSYTLFSLMGLYAMAKKYISIEQFSGLSKNAQSAMSTLFYDADETYWEARNVRLRIDQLFSNGFPFEAFSELANSSESDAVEYLRHGKQELSRTPVAQAQRTF